MGLRQWLLEADENKGVPSQTIGIEQTLGMTLSEFVSRDIALKDLLRNPRLRNLVFQ